jgi:hypothetical protein
MKKKGIFNLTINLTKPRLEAMAETAKRLGFKRNGVSGTAELTRLAIDQFIERNAVVQAEPETREPIENKQEGI